MKYFCQTKRFAHISLVREQEGVVNLYTLRLFMHFAQCIFFDLSTGRDFFWFKILGIWNECRVKQAYYLKLKRCYYSGNTVTFSRVFASHGSTCPPPNTIRVNTLRYRGEFCIGLQDTTSICAHLPRVHRVLLQLLPQVD